MKHLSSAILIVSVATLLSCNQSQTKEPATTNSVSYFDRSGMDSSVRPGDNFFLYANGNWMKTTVIPEDQSGWGSFYTLYEGNQQKIKGMLESAMKSNSSAGTIERKLGDYYASGMDSAAIEKLGSDPLKPMLVKIDAAKTYQELMNLDAEMNAAGQKSLLGGSVSADEKNSSQNIVIFSQTGLTLPEKGYYTRNDSATVAARNAVLVYARKLFTLTGSDTADAARRATSLLALETIIASSHRTPVELRDPQKNYNKMALTDLEKQAPNIHWKNYFDKISVKVDTVNVGQPGYFKGLNNLLASQPLEQWKTKMKFDYISHNANYLSKDFLDADFNFSKTFSGQKKDSDRWKKMVNWTDQGLGDLLGQLYVKKYFTDTAKSRMDELVSNLQKAFAVRIKNLDWMSDSTKQKALVKLNTFLKKIGYPTKWKNFDNVTIDKNNFFANVQNIRLHNAKEMIAKIGKPVDRMEWGMTAPTVNAYYNPTNNEVVFPAGILQSPFFDAGADDAVNYGAIGMVIGHEMTHGFDDQGSQYDDVGNMKNWWLSSDSSKFKSKTGGVVKQYNAYKILDTMHVNGELTLGENLADIGGLAIAYDAFKMTRQGKDSTKIDGFTPDQRFFLGFAQVWRLIDRNEQMRVRVSVDPHSPEMYRVNGPVVNFDPFYKAFGIKEGDKMFVSSENRAKIW